MILSIVKGNALYLEWELTVYPSLVAIETLMNNPSIVQWYTLFYFNHTQTGILYQDRLLICLILAVYMYLV